MRRATASNCSSDIPRRKTSRASGDSSMIRSTAVSPIGVPRSCGDLGDRPADVLARPCLGEVLPAAASRSPRSGTPRSAPRPGADARGSSRRRRTDRRRSRRPVPPASSQTSSGSSRPGRGTGRCRSRRPPAPPRRAAARSRRRPSRGRADRDARLAADLDRLTLGLGLARPGCSGCARRRCRRTRRRRPGQLDELVARRSAPRAGSRGRCSGRRRRPPATRGSAPSSGRCRPASGRAIVPAEDREADRLVRRHRDDVDRRRAREAARGTTRSSATRERRSGCP